MLHAFYRPRRKFGLNFVALSMFAILTMLCGAASATVYWEQSGHVTKPGGSPVVGFRLSLFVSGQPVTTRATDSAGHYQFDVQEGHAFTIAVAAPEIGQWYSYAPEEYSGSGWSTYQHYDFTARPWPKVRGTVNDVDNDGFAESGVEVLVDGELVDTTDANGDYEFTVGRDVFGLPSPGLTGTLLFRKSFHTYMPATMAYDATDGNDENMSSAAMKLDNLTALGNTSISWDYETGPGWNRFPLCPAHDITHNPNIYADLYFSPGYLSTLVPADHLRISAVPSGIIAEGGACSNNPVGSTYGRHTSFSPAIADCGIADLKLEIAVDQAGGGVAWYSVNSTESGASALDASGNGTVDLPDISIFSAASGSHFGDANYEACVDYNSDQAVNLSDISTLSAHYGHSDAKSLTQWEPLGQHTGILGVTATESREGVDLALAVRGGRHWRQLVVELAGNDWNLSELSWAPASGLPGVGVIATDDAGNAKLFVFSDGSTASGDLGVISIDKKWVDVAKQMTSLTELASMEVASDSDQSEGDIVGTTEPATAIRMWLSQSDRMAAGDPFRLRFELPRAMPVNLRIFDIRGRQVATLLSAETMQAGEHSANWDARDSSGHPVSSGVYFARLESGAEAVNQRLMVVR